MWISKRMIIAFKHVSLVGIQNSQHASCWFYQSNEASTHLNLDLALTLCLMSLLNWMCLSVNLLSWFLCFTCGCKNSSLALTWLEVLHLTGGGGLDRLCRVLIGGTVLLLTPNDDTCVFFMAGRRARNLDLTFALWISFNVKTPPSGLERSQEESIIGLM